MLEVSDQAARIGLQPAREPGGAVSKERTIANLPIDGMKWAKPATGNNRGRAHQGEPGARPGRRHPCRDRSTRTPSKYRLRQIPEISGAIVAMDPWTGRVLAMVGGFSFDQSQFNRATQALRQPGSSFKPFVYAAALDNGYTPSTVVMDAPIEVDTGSGWRLEAGKLFAQVLRAADPALRHRAFAQRDDGAACAGRRHAADRRIRQALRRLRRHADLSLLRARRGRDDRDAHGDRLFDVRERRQAHQADA